MIFPFSYGFPMVFLWVFLWFSYGFPIFLWFSHGFPPPASSRWHSVPAPGGLGTAAASGGMSERGAKAAAGLWGAMVPTEELSAGELNHQENHRKTHRKTTGKSWKLLHSLQIFRFYGLLTLIRTINQLVEHWNWPKSYYHFNGLVHSKH